MQNPWLMLAPEPPYVLDTDDDIITSYNKKADAEHRIDLALIPEPIGSRTVNDAVIRHQILIRVLTERHRCAPSMLVQAALL